MKTGFKLALLPAMLVMVLAFSSFHRAEPAAGGDYFEVYIGQELIVQQALHNDNGIKTFNLQPAHYQEKLSIRFTHCGIAGKKRMITLKDAEGRVLRTFAFAESKSKNGVMVCEAREVMDLQTRADREINLYYSSAELPGGRCLVRLLKG
jgi:hypothetical protein